VEKLRAIIPGTGAFGGWFVVKAVKMTETMRFAGSFGPTVSLVVCDS